MAKVKLTKNEQSILDAIKNGSTTIESISEKANVAKNVAHLLAGSLVKKSLVRKNPNDKTFSIVPEGADTSKIVCYGNLLLPVRFYVNKQTKQRYAIRGTWNPVEDHITEDDIQWIDDTISQKSKKGKTESKNRDGLAKPRLRVITPSKFQVWSELPLTDKQLSGEYKGKTGDFNIDFKVKESRGEQTHIEACINFKIGKITWSMYPVTKTDVLVDTDKLEKFIKGKGESIFTLEQFIWRNPDQVIQYPVDIKVNEDTSLIGTTIQFVKWKDINNLSWNVFQITCAATNGNCKFKKMSSGTGSLEEALKSVNGMPAFVSALEAFKIVK
ncbi:gp237 [Sphingomonas phage PAU]|uniref:gp237 n=1 Tax=Sphingomonas phage PAU TaxID=1150991 RepID=UPI000257338B|nr:gp237 [Sphingomonas phage PAU]AFF28235.1 gp237 [Sphingomonas phage PAU]